jgi:putative ABC transport system permease protein
MAMASRRYKEIGISKVLGAYKNQLRLQFMSEAIVTSLLALVVALLALPLVLPAFSGLLGTQLHFGLFSDKTLALGIVIFTVTVGAFSGVYPAFFVSSFEPQRVLKGVWKPGTGGTRFRKVLVGTQLAISIFLIIGTIVIYRQLGFIQSKGLGFDKEQIVMLNIRGTSIPRSYFTMKQQLENQSSVVKVSAVSEPVGREVQFMTFKLDL